MVEFSESMSKGQRYEQMGSRVVLLLLLLLLLESLESLTLKMTSTKFGDDDISRRHSEKNILDKIQDGRK